jgi:hypothetical protein
MNHYQQKEVKELYPAKDVIFTVVGVICAIVAGVWLAKFFTGWAGI